MIWKTIQRGVRCYFVATMAMVCFGPAQACFSSPRQADCTTFFDLDAAILSRDMRTYPDPKTPREHGQNWRDRAKTIDKAFDALGRVTLADPRVIKLASRTRQILPIQFALATELAVARETEDWPTYHSLRPEWDANVAKLADIKEDASVYCREPAGEGG